MKNVKNSQALLAILQQCEYDLPLFQSWAMAERSEELAEHVSKARPERWTGKLKSIQRISKPLISIGVPPVTALSIGVQLLQPAENLVRWYTIQQAATKLRRLQRNGLHVIGIAGSYGKTSAKNSVTHLLRSRWHTAATPESINTPLGIARDILRQLTSEHEYYVVELGEYQQGDIDGLLQWVRPEIGILTPVGHAHGSRFGSEKKLVETLFEIGTSSAAPATIIIDDHNLKLWNEYTPKTEARVRWYGAKTTSELSLQRYELENLQSGTAYLRWNDETYQAQSNLALASQVGNCLPGMLLLHDRGVPPSEAILPLRFHPPIERRMEISKYPNGVTLIDNSYNTNPSAWQGAMECIRGHQLSPLAVITAGFVELDHSSRKQAHEQLAADLLEVAKSVYVIRTRDNDDLIALLQKDAPRSTTIVPVLSQAEALEKLASSTVKHQYLWLEGGSRELYQ